MDNRPTITAADILALWRKVAPAFGHQASLWLRLLMIAEAGKTGLPVSRIERGSLSIRQTTRNLLKSAGKHQLIEVRRVRVNGDRLRNRAFITDAGLKVLGVGENETSPSAGAKE